MRDAGLKLGLALALLVAAGTVLYLAAGRAPPAATSSGIRRPIVPAPPEPPPGFDGVPAMPVSPPAAPESGGAPEAGPPPSGAAELLGARDVVADVSLAGTVLDAVAQADMTGFEALLWSADSVESVGFVTRESAIACGGVLAPGRFRFERLEPGARYFVGAAALGFIAHVTGPIAPSVEGGDIQLELHTPGHLMVRVLDEQGMPVSGVSVRCHVVSKPWPALNDWAVQSFYERSAVVSFADGTLAFRSLAPGEFWVGAGSPDLVSPPVRVQVLDAATTTVELVVGPTCGSGDLNVRVIDTRGESVPDARVMASRVLGPREDGTSSSRPCGLWSVSAWHWDHPQAWSSMIVGITPGGTTECTIRLGAGP